VLFFSWVGALLASLSFLSCYNRVTSPRIRDEIGYGL
jgi:hypothetical protein